MPGLIGSIKKGTYNIPSFEKAKETLIYDEKYLKDEVFEDENMIATRCHLGIIGNKTSPFEYKHIRLWIEGETYNYKIENLNKEICIAYINNRLESLLNTIDGYYCSVLYDLNQGIVLIWTDRYGVKPIYYNKSNFAWSSELKAFKYLNNNQNRLDFNAINDFLKLGHFLGNNTYFEDIKLVSASTIIKYVISSKEISSGKYWSWAEIEQNRDISFNDASHELFKLIEKAVTKRTTDNQDYGITLSGGIDSRVLLAITKKKIPAITFGIKNCFDNLIAKKVSDRNLSPHNFLELNDSNWYLNRIRSVWDTDGMFNFMHMHPSPFLHQLNKSFKLNLSGFAGDLNLGGGWINKLNSKISLESAHKRFKGVMHFDDIIDPFYDIPHEDPFYINNRVIRFTNGGSILLSKFIEQRKPFFDNELMDFTYSLPDEYRLNSKIYKDTIRKNIPYLFKNIPTTHDIIPLITSNKIQFQLKLKVDHFLMKMKLKQQYLWKYTDYENWFNQDNFQTFIKKLFKDPIIFSYDKLSINKDMILNQKNSSIEQIFICITLEIWLRQFYDEPIPSVKVKR